MKIFLASNECSHELDPTVEALCHCMILQHTIIVHSMLADTLALVLEFVNARAVLMNTKHKDSF